MLGCKHFKFMSLYTNMEICLGTMHKAFPRTVKGCALAGGDEMHKEGLIFSAVSTTLSQAQ